MTNPTTQPTQSSAPSAAGGVHGKAGGAPAAAADVEELLPRSLAWKAGLRSARRAGTQVAGGALTAMLGVLVSLRFQVPSHQMTLAVVVALAMAGAVTVVLAARAFSEAASRQRWLLRQYTEQVVTDATPGDALGTVVAGLRARAAEAERTRDLALEQVARAAAGMASAATTAVTAEEDVRAHLVAELHDTVAQTLVAAGYCEWFDDVDKDAVIAHVKTAERQVRDIMLAARPPALTDHTLAQAVEELARMTSTRRGVHVDVTWDDQDQQIPLTHATVVYRFIQEGLQNAVKHAGTDRAHVRFALADGVANVSVRDDGAGFDPNALTTFGTGGRHIGLYMLRQRAQMLSGSVEVTTAPGEGTTLCLTLPTPTRRPKSPLADTATAASPTSSTTVDVAAVSASP